MIHIDEIALKKSAMFSSQEKFTPKKADLILDSTKKGEYSCSKSLFYFKVYIVSANIIMVEINYVVNIKEVLYMIKMQENEVNFGGFE
jgi:hypothetical protein